MVPVILIAALVLTIIGPAFADTTVKNQNVVISPITDSVGSVNINVGKAEDIAVGTQGVVMRDGKQIANYKVESVNWGYSRVTISGLKDGMVIKAGDSAPITQGPPPTTKKKKSNSALWTAVGIVAAVALILILSHNGSSSSSSNNTITLTAKKTSDGTGNVNAVITATVKDGNGQAVPDGTTITFATNGGTINPASTWTVSGVATSNLAYTSGGPSSAVVTVKCLDKTATINVSFTNSMTLSASPAQIQIQNSGPGTTTSTITATCVDANNNPWTAGGQVTFNTNIGTINGSPATINANGIATVTLTSTQPGKTVVTGTWSNNTATANVTITDGPPTNLSVSSSTNTLECDGNSIATITATVKDAGGNPVTDGTVVDFSVVPDGNGGGNGTITNPEATTVNGTCSVPLVSHDSSNNKSKAGTATIKVQVLAAKQPSTVPPPTTDLTNSTTQIQFIPADVSAITLTASQSNVRGLDKAGNTVTITALVTSGNTFVPDGTAVTFTSNYGAIAGSNANVSTTHNGIATATLTTKAEGGNGIVNVTATSGSYSTTANGLVIFSGPPVLANCSANMSQNTLKSLGGQATVTVVAKDINNNNVADGMNVTLNAGGGGTNTSGSTTLGQATLNLATSTNNLVPTPTGSYTATVSIEPSGANVQIALPFTVTN
jgi:hypothetical protein